MPLFMHYRGGLAGIALVCAMLRQIIRRDGPSGMPVRDLHDGHRRKNHRIPNIRPLAYPIPETQLQFQGSSAAMNGRNPRSTMSATSHAIATSSRHAQFRHVLLRLRLAGRAYPLPESISQITANLLSNRQESSRRRRPSRPGRFPQET
jgi:hypothetical protein